MQPARLSRGFGCKIGGAWNRHGSNRPFPRREPGALPDGLRNRSNCKSPENVSCFAVRRGISPCCRADSAPACFDRQARIAGLPQRVFQCGVVLKIQISPIQATLSRPPALKGRPPVSVAAAGREKGCLILPARGPAPATVTDHDARQRTRQASPTPRLIVRSVRTLPATNAAPHAKPATRHPLPSVTSVTSVTGQRFSAQSRASCNREAKTPLPDCRQAHPQTRRKSSCSTSQNVSEMGGHFSTRL